MVPVSWTAVPVYDSRFPEELYGFFEAFEAYGQEAGLETREMTRKLVLCAEPRDKRHWKCLDGYDDDYEVLKKTILGQYAASELDGTDFSKKDLKKFIKQLKCEDINDEEEFEAYQRRFSRRAKYLLEEDIIDDDNCDWYFWEGLPSKTRKKIRSHLRLRKHSYVPLWKDAITAGRAVFGDTWSDSDTDSDTDSEDEERVEKEEEREEKKEEREEVEEMVETRKEDTEEEETLVMGEESTVVKSGNEEAEELGIGQDDKDGIKLESEHQELEDDNSDPIPISPRSLTSKIDFPDLLSIATHSITQVSPPSLPVSEDRSSLVTVTFKEILSKIHNMASLFSYSLSAVDKDRLATIVGDLRDAWGRERRLERSQRWIWRVG